MNFKAESKHKMLSINFTWDENDNIDLHCDSNIFLQLLEDAGWSKEMIGRFRSRD